MLFLTVPGIRELLFLRFISYLLVQVYIFKAEKKYRQILTPWILLSVPAGYDQVHCCAECRPVYFYH